MKYTAKHWKDMIYPNLTILDYDGFDKENFEYSFNQEEIGYMEFEWRMGYCTVRGKLGGWDDDDIRFKEDPEEFFKK